MAIISLLLNCFMNTVILTIIAILVALKIYLKIKTGKCSCETSMIGKTVIVTGANRGIGKETACELAKRGAKVIIACRDLKSGSAARDEIVSISKNKQVFVRELDLSSVSSIHEFAQGIIDSEERLDVLINNAGTGYIRQKFTKDKMLALMQVNHFGPFLLTMLLLELLKKSAPSRIIMVTSLAHKYASPEIGKYNTVKAFGSQTVYNNSKVCNILFTKQLSKKLNGTGVTINAANPGAVLTDVFRSLPKVYYNLVKIIGKLYFKTPLEGAQTSVYLAVSPEVEHVSGKYFSDCKEDKASELAMSAEAAEEIWKMSEELVGINTTVLLTQTTVQPTIEPF